MFCGAQQLKVGALLLSAVEGGGISLQPEDNIGGVQLAIMHLNSLRQHVAGRGMVVRIGFFASLENSWMLPGGIRRRTHPGFTSAHESFTSEQQVRTWLATPKGRAMSRSNTLRWHVVASPRRAQR